MDTKIDIADFTARWFGAAENHEAEPGPSGNYRWLPEAGEEVALCYLTRFARDLLAAAGVGDIGAR